ncbi:hypothetical protein IGI37_002928 [Enterococcus sp. AZ194]|uniref:hypothetical protein n=1 Tax=Enterococcus sp. AZ194 TaxID=2774629 RepID=UPI003F28B9E8
MDYFSDEFLAYLELKQDMFFDKIPANKVSYYIHKGLEAGSSYAETYRESTIEELYAMNAISIKTEEHDGEFFKVKLRAQFETDSKGHNQVYLYKKSILPLAKANGLSYEEMSRIILAHEFFHHVEFGLGKTIAESTDKVVSLRFLGVKRQVNIQRVSEIAANAFTKKFLQLPHLPNYYDYQYLIQSGELSQKELEEEYIRLEKILTLK